VFQISTNNQKGQLMQTKYGSYQEQSRKTYSDIETNDFIVYPTLGLVNEAGEFAGKIKKVFRDKNGEFTPEVKEALKGELGDVLWYLTQICTNLGFSLEEIAEANLDKLFSRLERGTIQGEGDNR
jgi:NTP pyrophosphatase (non-canonical NTP hydrolase)